MNALHFAVFRTLLFLMVGFSPRPAYSQPHADAPALTFEVASIKPSKNTTNGNFFEIPPGGQRFSATNATLKLLILTAYDVSSGRSSGGPGWMGSEGYDVEAKAERPVNREQLRLMLQSLLADRFSLKLHKETKELPVYVLTPENDYAHLRENKSAGEPHAKRGSSGQMVFEDVSMSQLASFLVVADRGATSSTRQGLRVTLISSLPRRRISWPVAERIPRLHLIANGPSIFTALREQLGLKLTATKSPGVVLTVDNAEKPSAN